MYVEGMYPGMKKMKRINLYIQVDCRKNSKMYAYVQDVVKNCTHVYSRTCNCVVRCVPHIDTCIYYMIHVMYMCNTADLGIKSIFSYAV